MAYQAVFRRYELKYLLTPAQKEIILQTMSPHMAPDRYGRTVIRNIYFDTADYRLIRRSIERPAYKEKLRLRSYELATPDSRVFAELKKKYDHVVYKRRLSLGENEAMAWLNGTRPCPQKTQIAAEINYLLGYYGDLRPTVFLSYEREAYYPLDGSDFRITFDQNILCRREALSLCSEAYGKPILEAGMTLMELKCSGGIPLWLVEILSREHIYKTSFSKYGTAYETMILPKLKEKRNENF